MARYLKLNNGERIPTVGLGTWQLKDSEAIEAITNCIKAGYRHIDCAMLYGNEASLGKALHHVINELKLVRREELFIVSKLWCNSHKKDDVKPALKKSLEDLQLKYLDLYLIHHPISFKSGSDMFPLNSHGRLIYDDVPPVETWKAMEKCVKDGLVKSIGLSNFNIKQIKDILQHAEIKPVVLQTEVYPYLQCKKVIEFCSANDIVVTGYGCLGSSGRTWEDKISSCLEDKLILKLSDKYKRTPAQIILRWLLQRNIVVLAKSSNPKRIKENIAVFDFNLSEEDVAEIGTLDKGLRTFGMNIDLKGIIMYEDEHVPHNPFLEE